MRFFTLKSTHANQSQTCSTCHCYQSKFTYKCQEAERPTPQSRRHRRRCQCSCGCYCSCVQPLQASNESWNDSQLVVEDMNVHVVHSFQFTARVMCHYATIRMSVSGKVMRTSPSGKTLTMLEQSNMVTQFKIGFRLSTPRLACLYLSRMDCRGDHLSKIESSPPLVPQST